MPEPMRPIKYIVAVGDPRDGGMTSEYNWDEEGPVSLFDNTQPVNPENFVAWAKFHHERQRALLHHLQEEGRRSGVPWMPGRFPDEGAPSELTAWAIGGKEPTIIDFAAPVCIATGTCHTQASKQLREALEHAPGIEILKPGLKSCAVCGQSDTVKPCSGCRDFAYCSKECQKTHWPFHKKHCRHVQAVKAATEAGSMTAAALLNL
ncbi:hypothetical protein MBM_01266 [Drepanopeziza brunnea f. sp. 'multigermtubi' MB_m1]|uniref:MYND-type domain-containing protein n=1 Tax=Marssonina brunnea f. sp. multigermtubi (strain MB_m1) TaxID=1072389 RepID=K1Y5X0_MARBU|nr:uncharacterized protein MBM_01266 [Drepanopeziza brunnea f. sp. 'multigermtubi' MB_m1]EKD20584.1 hypothetical protein MBM_01266 [Drepanopeziza brunnea f. sp. 'multigermtubi' MB_m1]